MCVGIVQSLKDVPAGISLEKQQQFLLKTNQNITMDEEEDYTCDLTEEELFDLTEKLLENDENNCSQYFRYNLQERRCGEEDTCDEPLFSEVDQDALFEVPTIKTLMALHDNYIPVSSKYFY